MTKRSLLGVVAGGALLAALPVHAQVVQPDPTQPGNYPLPNGSAKTVVQEKCVVCHDLRNIVNSNKSAEDWDNTVNMMAAAGAAVNDAQIKEIKAYLIASFPERPRPQPAKIGGPVQVKFTQWNTPTPGSR